MRRHIFIFTGIIGLGGGLGTLALGSSCDVECMRDDRPSVILRVLTVEDGVTQPLSASEVTYRFRGHARDEDAVEGSLTAAPLSGEGYCLDSACASWALGMDQAGVFEVEVEACGTTHSRRIDVPFDDEACHADTQQSAVVVDCDEPRPAVVNRTCDATARPSVFVYVAREHDDYFDAVPVERVWFEHDGGRAVEATCAMVDVDGPCSAWIAGWELDGRFRVSTEWCDTVVEQAVSVGKTEDGCHVETEFLILPVSSIGCATSDPGYPPPDPDPTGPREAYG